MIKRTQTRPVQIGSLTMGGSNHVIIQSMLSSRTSDVEASVTQILELEAMGCELVRMAVIDEADVKAIPQIKKQVHIPLVADIHFDYRIAIMAVEAGIDKIRLNPGNIGSRENVEKVVEACRSHHVPIRIGINSGSLEKDIHEKYGKPTAAGMIESARRHVQILEDLGFYDIVLSFKSSDPKLCIEAYQEAAKQFPYPLHLGVTEAGTITSSAIKSSYALGYLLHEGIGDTIRISVNGHPRKEIPIVKQLLKSVGLLDNVPNLIACPTCGRTQWDISSVVDEIEAFLQTIHADISVAIMGCAVNGPGEAKHADIAIAGGKQEGLLIKRGVIVEKLPQEQMVARLKEEILTLAKLQETRS